MSKVEIIIDMKLDAWNWWSACNKISHGVDWKKRIDFSVYSELEGKDQATANIFLLPYLEEYYRVHEAEIQAKLAEARCLFKSQVQSSLEIMEKVTGKPIYRDSFTCVLTTFPRCPYNFEKGLVWLCVLWPTKRYLGIFLHELLHFQYLKYFADLPQVNALASEQSDFLKEALTVVLNDEFSEFLGQKDSGYEIHKELRTELEKIWEQNKDFKSLVLFGAAWLTENQVKEALA